MKAGEIVTFAHVEGARSPAVSARWNPDGDRQARPVVMSHAFTQYGTHSSPEYGVSDGSEPVAEGRAEYVVVCKVIAVVRRSVKVET